jgi:SPP1 family predicted phage head-tail adaptor
MALIRPNLDRRVTIKRPVAAQEGRFGSSKPTWKTLAVVWGERQDILPSRNVENTANGMATGVQRTRYRIRWRADVNATMRLEEGGAVYQIVGGPAEIGRQEYLELLCERFSADGTV